MPSADTSRAGSSPPKRHAGWSSLLRRWDLWAALLLFGYVTLFYLKEPFPVVVPTIDYVDHSWELDLIAKAGQGKWLGRDVVFTYGPLFQWLFSRRAAFAEMSLGGFYYYLVAFQQWTAVFFTWVAVWLFQAEQAAWKRAFSLVLLCVFWVPLAGGAFNIKVLVPLCCMGFFLRLFRRAGKAQNALWYGGGFAGLLIAIAFWLSADAGTYTLAGFTVALLAFAGYARNGPRLLIYLKLAISAALGFFFGAVLGQTLLRRPLDFGYWRSAYEVVANYRWVQGHGMLPSVALMFALAICFGLLVLLRAFKATVSDAERASLAALILWALLMLQSGLIDSDNFHVALSLFPLLAVGFMVLMGACDESESPLRPAMAVLAALVLTAIFSGPANYFRPIFWPHAVREQCPSGTREVDRICTTEQNANRLSGIASAIDSNTAASDEVVIFPYQNIYGFVAKRAVAGGVLQNYTIAGNYLTGRFLAPMEAHKPAVALYSADGIATQTLEGVPTFTRTPGVWLWLQRWYKAAAWPQPGIGLLKRDDDRGARWQIKETETATDPRSHPVRERETIDLATLKDPAPDLDFIKLVVRVDYPAYWRLLKTSAILFSVQYENGEEKLVPAIAQPNHPYEIWIYPYDDAELMNYFSADPAEWRGHTARPRVKSITVRFQKMDWASVLPTSVRLLRLQTVSLTAH